MAVTREEVIAELRPMFNHVGIYCDTHLYRLVGFGEDDSDYYYILRCMNGERHRYKDNQFWGTFVARFRTLKGLLPDLEYQQTDNVFAWNGAPRAEEFLILTDKVSA